MFDTTREDLHDILKRIESGKLQLPDFQRDYVWEDDDVKSLVVSISKGFPVGALLSLETGGPVTFKPRLIEGVPYKKIEPAELLLDGQQRMTSLYQAMFHDCPVRTRSKRQTVVERHYYLDIKKATSDENNMEEAVIGVPADRVVRTNFGKNIVMDLSTRQAEYERDLFPLHLAFDHSEWIYEWRDYWRGRGRDVSDLDRSFVFKGVISRIQRYKMPIIRLDKENSREAICLVFEKVNVGGKKLDAFELVTAIFATDNFDLREDWYGRPALAQESDTKPKPGRYKAMLGEVSQRDVLTTLANTDFLQACTVLHTLALRKIKALEGAKGPDLPRVSCNRDALLGLPLSAYKAYADSVQQGFCEAARFLSDLRIIRHRDMPYPPIRVALAAVFALLEQKEWTAAAKEKLKQWFWCISLGELYGSSTESRIARDVPELVAWLRNEGPQPRSNNEAIFQIDRLKSLRSRLSAAYKAVHVLLMHKGSRDFISGHETQIMTFFDDKIDIHHVFPQAWCKRKENGIPHSRFNSIINKSPLSKLSNILIGGNAPSVYLAAIENKHGLSSEQLDDILRSHLIEPSYLRNDDFEGFWESRMHALADLIGSAMGKPVVMEHGRDEVEVDDDADEIEDMMEEATEE